VQWDGRLEVLAVDCPLRRSELVRRRAGDGSDLRVSGVAQAQDGGSTERDSVEMATSRRDEESGCPLGGLTSKFDPRGRSARH
jgi:hypothetical protein